MRAFNPFNPLRAAGAVGGGGSLPPENGNVIDNIFSGSNISGIQEVSASASRGHTPPWYAVDGSIGSIWKTGSTSQPPQWWKIDFGQPEVVYSIRLYTQNRNGGIINFDLESSDDDASWVSRLNATITVHDSYVNYNLTTPAEARYWRVYINSSISSQSPEMSDIQFRS